MNTRPIPSTKEMNDLAAQLAQGTGYEHNPWVRQAKGREFKEQPENQSK